MKKTKKYNRMKRRTKKYKTERYQQKDKKYYQKKNKEFTYKKKKIEISGSYFMPTLLQSLQKQVTISLPSFLNI